jgi:hypothetical protein
MRKQSREQTYSHKQAWQSDHQAMPFINEHFGDNDLMAATL